MKAYYLRGNYQNSFKNKVGEKERVEEKCNKQKSLPLGRLMRLRERLKCVPQRERMEVSLTLGNIHFRQAYIFQIIYMYYFGNNFKFIFKIKNKCLHLETKG